MENKTNVELMLQRFMDSEIINRCPSFIKLMKLQLYQNTYRGAHNLQHDRKNETQIAIFLKTFYDVTVNKEFKLLVAPGDNRDYFYSKFSGDNANRFDSYIRLVDSINNNPRYFEQGKGKSQSNDQYATIKKQLLKNLFDMGDFVHQFYLKSNGSEILLRPGETSKGKKNITYMLDSKVIELIEKGSEKDLFDYILSVQSRYLANHSSSIIKFLTDELSMAKNVKTVNKDLYTLTLSYWKKKNVFGELTDFTLIKNAYYELLNNRTAVSAIISIYKDMSARTAKGGDLYYNKNTQIDWGNFTNQTGSLFNHLANTPGFALDKNLDIYSEFMKEDEVESKKYKKPPRSSLQKSLYFENHNLNKEDFKTYELHHIYPLEKAQNYNEWKLADSWENLILITPNGHALFPNRNNNFTKIELIDEENFWIKPISDFEEIIEFKNNQDVEYDVKNRNAMLEKNKILNEL